MGLFGPDYQGAPTLGISAPPTMVEVDHTCGHRLRWHFFKTREQLRHCMQVASDGPCPRCESPALSEVETDVVYPGTGVCHAHIGGCPDSIHARWLSDMGVRILGLHLSIPR